MRIIALIVLIFVSGISCSQEVAFYPDIAPIIHKHCSTCHRPNKAGPFSLSTYDDVAKHSKMIEHVTQIHYMPPWKADTTYRKFLDQRILSQVEIDLISKWVNSNLPVGVKGKNYSEPIFPDSSAFGKPDLVLKLAEPFLVKGNNRDTVVFFELPYQLANDTNVMALEFVPGNPRVVHHSNTKVIYTEFVPPEHCWNFMAPDSILDMNTVYYDGWVPGAFPRVWPEGIGFRMPKYGMVLLQIHYAPSPVEEFDQSYLNVYFTDKKIYRRLDVFNIGTSGGIAEPEPELVLPPESIDTFWVKAEVAKDLSYLYLNPHMHRLGKEMKAFAVTPENDTIPLVWIKDWDYRWQDFYKPETMIKIPTCSIIHLFAVFDNTAENPVNSCNPPCLVRAGPNTSDEMMSLIIASIPYENGDENIRLTEVSH
jgi:hypothetical protein